MVRENVADKIIEADVLVIGGGIAGSFAAIKAAEEGVRVVLWEKAAVQRSGGASGEPMFWQGAVLQKGEEKPEMILSAADKRAWEGSLYYKEKPERLDGVVDKNYKAVVNRDVWDRIHDLENWGVNLRWDNGEYKVSRDPESGATTSMRIRPKGLKKILLQQLIKSGVELHERTMGIDLLTQDGAVVGATGLNIRSGQFIVCKAKAVVIATPGPCRMMHQASQGPAVGKYKMIYDFVPDAGDGGAMALRAGAEMVNLEFPWGDVVLMYLFDGFCGKVGMVDQVRPRIPIVNSRGEIVNRGVIRLHQLLKEEEAGRTPCYLDATGLPEEALEELEAVRYDEFPLAARMSKVRGADWRTHKFEIADYFPYGFSGGILVDVDTKSRVKGLFAAGTCAFYHGALSGASVFGAIAGKNSAKYGAEAGKPTVDESQVKAQKESVFAPMKVRDGVPPLELEMKLRDITYRYCGLNRSEGKLNQGLWRLRSVRDKFFPEMVARTPHELMTCQEVRNAYLIGEAILVSARERKESAPGFFRKDYPEKADEPLKGAIVARLEDGEIKASLRRMPELREEFKKGDAD